MLLAANARAASICNFEKARAEALEALQRVLLIPAAAFRGVLILIVREE